MKKSLIGLALIAASGASLATEHYSGRLSGMAGSGFVTGHYSDGVLLNPSLAAKHTANDHFALVINAGALGIEKHDIIDNVDDLSDLIDDINNSPANLTQAQADRLSQLLHRIDGNYVRATPSASVTLSIPNEVLSLALFYKASGSVNLLSDISDSDFDLIDNYVNQPFDPDDLSSTLSAQGVLVKEFGVALAKDISNNSDYQILVGVTPKRVELDTYLYDASVADYDEDDLDADDYKTTSKTSNLVDVGFTLINGPLHAGLSINNINGYSAKTIDPNINYRLQTKGTLALGYVVEGFKAEIAADVNKVEVFGIGDSQIVRAGVEYSPLSWLQLRAGVQTDLEDALPDAYSLGIGFWPGEVFNIDLAGFGGQDGTLGAALQLGLHF